MKIEELSSSDFSGWRIIVFPAETSLDTGLENLRRLIENPEEIEELIIKDLFMQTVKWADEMNEHFWDTAKRLERRLIVSTMDKVGGKVNLSIKTQIIKKLNKGVDSAVAYRIFELRMDINEYVCKGDWRKIFEQPVSLRVIFLPGYETMNVVGGNISYYKYFVSFIDKIQNDRTKEVLKLIHENYSEVTHAIKAYEGYKIVEG